MTVDCRVDQEAGGIVVASLSGHFDAGGADQVWDAAAALLDEEHPSLLVDMSEVELMTSAGLGALVRLLHRVQKLGGKIAVFGANTRVKDVVEVVMLAEILNLCGTIDEARIRVQP